MQHGIPVTIINGFLGSGKTTLLRNLLAQSQVQQAIPGVIVNDMSTLDVDGVLIANTDIVNVHQGNFVTISGDSISSQSGLRQLNSALQSLCDKQAPDWIIIETSGSSHPLPLVKYFRDQTRFALKGVITLVDATWLNADYDAGQTLIPQWQHNLQQGIRHVENLLAEQMLFSSALLLTKTDRLPVATVQTIAQAIHPINPHIAIQGMAWGGIGVDEIRAMPDYDYFRVEKLITELEPVVADVTTTDKMVSRVINDDRPFHPERLWYTCHHFLSKGIFRSKGFFWLASRDRQALLWNQASGNIGLELVGYWRIGILEHDTDGLTPEEVTSLQANVAQYSSRFGDRRCSLTVIGLPDAVDPFVAALEQSFLTAEELTHWEKGGHFDDPWPTQLKSL